MYLVEGNLMQATQPQQMVGSKRVSGGIFLVPILAFMLMVWLFALHMYPDIYAEHSYGLSLELWRIVGLIILIILIAIILMAFMSTGNTTVVVSSPTPMKAIVEAEKPPEVILDDTPEEKPSAGDDDKPEFVEDEKAEKPKEKGPQMIDYPPKITGGVYGDNVIPLGQIAKVNIRTIIIRACSICGHKAQCWSDVKDVLDEDDFKFNVDCIPGLEKMIKAKEKEVPKLNTEFFAEYVKWT